MNQFQTQLFANLVSLINTNEAFYKQQFESDGHIYWIFNYRLASYTDFLAPAALECRGIMFEVDATGAPLALKSLPMEKFHNLNECPFTQNLDLTQVDEILLKADGSLMSTYTHNETLMLKSKGSIASEQCLAAMDWINADDNREFRSAIQFVEGEGYTVNLEWCSPVHRIVIGYAKPHLKVLNARNRETGVYMDRFTLEAYFGDNAIDLVEPADPVAFVASIPAMTEDIEGYVVRLKSGQRVKIKTEKYLSLHHAKDSVNNPRRLFEAILDEGIDDLRSLFYTDAVAMQMIDEMQVRVDHLYNNMVKMVEEFYDANKHLERKDYAIKGQAELDRLYFGLAMTKYLDKPVDYKGFMKSKYKDLGIRDTQLEGE